MKKLTENLIQQRLKSCTTDLDKVLQINVTGRELEDVSLLKCMTGVEILSLSVNHISSLHDFQYCKNLKELYLRHNRIADLNQISYLKNLSKLELLMLSQNPCAEDPLYRMTVIRNLKNLKELDGAPVTLEERRQAQKLGLEVNLNDKLGCTENFIPDGSQIERTPTQSTQKLKAAEENLSEVTEIHGKKTDENDNEETGVKLELDERTNASLLAIKKDKKHFIPEQPPLSPPALPLTSNPSASVPDDNLNRAHCKVCGNATTEGTHCVPFIPNNSNNVNILSAVLNLIKELDYSGLQIINAEVASRLNAFELEYICQRKPFLGRSRIKEIMHNV